MILKCSNKKSSLLLIQAILFIAQVKKCKAEADKSKKSWAHKEQEEKSLHLELEELKKSIQSAEEQLTAVDQAIAGWQKDVEAAQEEVTTAQQDVSEAKEKVKMQKDAMNLQNNEIMQKNKRKEAVKKKNSDTELKIQQHKHEVKTDNRHNFCNTNLNQYKKVKNVE